MLTFLPVFRTCTFLYGLLAFGLCICFAILGVISGREHGFIVLDQNVYQAFLNEPSCPGFRILELADLITDLASTALIFNQIDSGSQRLVIFALVMSILFNAVYVLLFSNNDRKRDYRREKYRLILGLALFTFEDAILVPINLEFCIGFIREIGETANSDEFKANDLTVLIELLGVMMSALLGISLGISRFFSMLRFTCCGNPIYSGSYKVLENFIEWETEKTNQLMMESKRQQATQMRAQDEKIEAQVE